jgi:hypothetical protein
MKRQILILLLVTIAASSHAQLHFSIDNLNPCPGQPVTFSLPSISGCSNARVLSEADWNIFPAPLRSEVHYNFSAQNGVNGYTSVTVTYASYHATISVHATYACDGRPTGTVSDLVLMMPPVSGPAIVGLDDNIYPGDQSTVAISATNAISYSWQLSIVQTISGSIDEGAIADKSAQQTVINWPVGFVGVVDITANATSCSEAKQTTKRISVLTPPAAVFYESSVTPSARCAGTSIRYRLEIFGGFTVTQAQVIVSPGATDISVFNTKNGVPVEWSVKWAGDGDIRVRYSVSNGHRTWADLVTPTLSFDVLEYDAGQIHAPPFIPYCAPAAITLSLDRQPVGSPYSFQYCNAADCSMASSNWMDNDPPDSPMFAELSTNTNFRIKLTDNRCGTFQSTPVSITVKPTPSIIVSDKVMFSGGTFDIPSSNMPFSVVSVKATSSGVRGASDVSIFQGFTMGTLATQTLATEGQSEGTVVYSITPSKDECNGQAKKATVNVYQRPVIDTDHQYVYKGLEATLKTGSFDSYLWQTESGTMLGTDPTYQTAEPGTYVVTVTKNGARATSDPLTIGDQFAGINENYILTRQPLREFTSTSGFENLSEYDIAESILYIDDIGRPKQNIEIRMSPSRHDLVQPFAYDQYGRTRRKFLPYVSAEDNGRIRPYAIASEQPGFYQNDDPTIPSDAQPYAETVFDNSPLNRTLKQGAAGSAWQPQTDEAQPEHVIKYEYLLNTLADSVMRFSYDYENETIVCLSGTAAVYAPGVLYKNKTIDEDDHEMIEFIDKLNRIVCKKVKAAGNTYACTYYIYDDIGNLVTVLSPEGTNSIISSLTR